ncbi:hypothetical protein H0H93_014317 [Arthromyces matolae]|nr:hypothetical protein H0H93_014317 [Arthromyces matolae]
MFRPTLAVFSKKPRSTSIKWLDRQFNDPYVRQRLSDPRSFRARSAFKLLEIDDRYNFLNKPDVKTVIDLGAAPGGWSQVVAGKLGWDDSSESSTTSQTYEPSVKWSEADPEAPFDPLNIDDFPEETPGSGHGTIVAMDLLRMQPIRGVNFIQANFLTEEAERLIQGVLELKGHSDTKFDVILSDIARNVTGNHTTDVESSLEICQAVFKFATRHLRTAQEIGRPRGGVLFSSDCRELKRSPYSLHTSHTRGIRDPSDFLTFSAICSTSRLRNDLLPAMIIETTEKRPFATDEANHPSSGASFLQVEPPDGGLQAWLTILGGWLMYFCGLGVFQDFYVREFLPNESPSKIAWIGSFEIALQFLLGIPVGMAFDAGYFHYLMIGGSLIYSFSLFMVSLAQPGKYYQLFLAQGVGMGLGLAMTFLPALTVVAHHFNRRRGFAIGIMTSGASIGGLVFPIMLNKLIFGRQGFALGVRATAAVITGLLVIANLLMRTRPRKRAANETRLKRLPARTLFTDIPYMMFVVSGIFLTLGIFYPIFYLQLFSVKHGIDESLAFYVISFINTGGLFGRLVPNFLADKVGSYNVLIPASFACAAFVFAILGIQSPASAIIVAILYGAMNGTHISVTPAVLSDLSSDIGEVGQVVIDANSPLF